MNKRSHTKKPTTAVGEESTQSSPAEQAVAGERGGVWSSSPPLPLPPPPAPPRPGSGRLGGDRAKEHSPSVAARRDSSPGEGRENSLAGKKDTHGRVLVLVGLR